MRVMKVMQDNKDTTAWGGVSVILGLVLGRIPSDLEQQFIVIVVFPAFGYLTVALTKEIYNYVRGHVVSWREKRKTKNNAE